MTSDRPSVENLESQIDELKKQNELLRQNQGLSPRIVDSAGRLLFENSFSGNLLIDINGVCLDSNRRAAEGLGLTPDQIIGKNIFDFLPYETASAYIKKNKELIESGMSAEYEDTFQLEMGEKTFLISDQVLKDEHGQGYALLSSSIDITERKQAEESLRVSKKLYRLLVRNLPGTTVFLFNHQLCYILAEGFLSPDFGFTTELLEGKTLWEVLPEDKAVGVAPIYRNALQGIPTENLITEIDGHSYSVNILPVKNKKGKIVAGMVVSQEITERKRVEEELKANYSLLRIAGETAKFGGWSLNIAKNKVIWSDEVAAIHEMPAGYSPALEEGINFYAPEWQNVIASAAGNCVKNGIPFDEELELITAKGNRIWVRVIGEAVRDTLGKIFKIQGSFQDISERKQTEGIIRESEERFRSLLQNVSSVSVQGYAPDGTTQYWNKASELLYGYTEQEAIGRNLLDLIIPPEMTEDVKQAVLQMAETGEVIPSSELSLMRRDGSRVAVYSSHSIVQVPGKMPELFCIDIDISDRKRAEAEVLKSKQQFDNLVAQIPVGVYVLKTNPDYTFALEYVSPRMAEILDSSVESLLASTEPVFKAIHPDDLVGFSRLNLEGIKQKQPFDWKGRAVVKGVVKWLHMSSLPQQQRNGDILWHGLIVDITEQMHDEEEIKQQNEKLQELNATKDKFFSIIAHDLKSPFNSIIGFSSLLTRQIQEKDFASIEKYAGIIQNSSQQAMDLLMNLLEWSRSQTGRIVFTPENIYLTALIYQTLELLYGSAQQKSINISSEIHVNRPVYADKAMISTILRNLISNAIKFTKAGGGISVSAEQISDEVVVSVSDNGVGMGKESIAKLFRIDQNYTTLGTENEKGTGLGLLLCKEFIEKHGGRIWVESAPGKGSKFSFAIPETKIPNTKS